MNWPKPINPNELPTIIAQKLNVNPLLWSLYTISPADALELIGLGYAVAILDVRRAVGPEDRAQVVALINAIRRGSTGLDVVQTFTPHPVALDQALLNALLLTPERPAKSAPVTPATPVRAAVPARPAPDMQLIVARPTIQFALRTYAQHAFIGRVFPADPLPWLHVEARGTAIAIDLAHGAAQISATFDCAATVSVKLGGRTLPIHTTRGPVEIVASGQFSVNRAGQLCIGVGPGEVRSVGLPIPTKQINTLYQRLHAALPAVPIIYLPTSFPIAADPSVLPSDFKLDMTHVTVSPDALTLDFQLFVGPAAGTN